MRSAHAVRVPPPVGFVDEPVFSQVPLPFPDLAPVVPAPLERDNLAGTTVLRRKASHFMQALVEVLAGDRPARQMAVWMAPDVYDQLARRMSVGSRRPRQMPAGRRARVVSVHLAMTDAETAEIAARFVVCGRSRAIAVRLELRQNHRAISQWLCTAVVWG